MILNVITKNIDCAITKQQKTFFSSTKNSLSSSAVPTAQRFITGINCRTMIDVGNQAWSNTQSAFIK